MFFLWGYIEDWWKIEWVLNLMRMRFEHMSNSGCNEYMIQ